VIRAVTESLKHSLLALPESGIRYQIVDAEYENGRQEQLVALNASILANSWSEIRKAAGDQRSFVERLKLAARRMVTGSIPASKSFGVTLFPIPHPLAMSS